MAKASKIPAPSVKAMFERLNVDCLLTLDDCKLLKALCDGERNSKRVGEEMGLASSVKDWPYLERFERILWITNALINKRGDELRSTLAMGDSRRTKGLAHGVEVLRSTLDTMHDFNGLTYVNLGDTYDTTLIYCSLTQRFKVCAWGYIVERAGKRFQ